MATAGTELANMTTIGTLSRKLFYMNYCLEDDPNTCCVTEMIINLHDPFTMEKNEVFWKNEVLRYC